MQDLKRSKRKMYNKQMSNMKTKEIAPIVEVEELQVEELQFEDLERGCKSKNNCGCGCGCGCEEEATCKKQETKPAPAPAQTFNCQCTCTPVKSADTCEPCQADEKECMINNCGEQCCCPIDVEYSTRNACPVAIQTERIYDAVKFQIFTDATAPEGEPLYFEYEVAEVKGAVPAQGYANIKIDEVCMNYSSIEVIPGCVGVDDFEVLEVEDNAPCDTRFEYVVCSERNAGCCKKGKGQGVSYKQKGLTAVVNDLVLELKGHCGCTEVIAYAYPATRRMGGQLCRVDYVEFRYNTLACRLCVPSDGKSFELDQDYDVNLSVDCISKAYISADPCGCDCDCECNFNLEIPCGIDLICCLKEEVSVIINEQLVVLAASQAINPRTVDTFANVCSFPSCGCNSEK